MHVHGKGVDVDPSLTAAEAFVRIVYTYGALVRIRVNTISAKKVWESMIAKLLVGGSFFLSTKVCASEDFSSSLAWDDGVSFAKPRLR